MFSNIAITSINIWANVFFAIISAIYILYLFREWNTYKKIRKTGIKGFGLLTSCKRVYFIGGRIVAFIPLYDPIIKFFYMEKYYELRAMGRFHFRPGKVGDEIEIIISEKYPDKVVISNEHIINHYIWSILFLGGLYIFAIFVFIFM